MIGFPFTCGEKMRKPIMSPTRDSALLKDLGRQFRDGRKRIKLTQDEVAAQAGLSRVSYRAIETGAAAPRAGTLINIARALGMEMMLIPKEIVPAVHAMVHAGDDDQPAFTADADEVQHE
jgi:DNA-binding XRE family transcriptional regulator